MKYLFPVVYFLSAINLYCQETWIVKSYPSFELQYTAVDAAQADHYILTLENGISTIEKFFGNKFPNKFIILIHPDRISLDASWQSEWGMPDFHSECWMVASGVADKFHLLSPRVWDQEACEHQSDDEIHLQRLLTHELVHVYHGQHNKSPDFSDISGIDWLVEGLATYVSGQYDSARIADLKKQVKVEELSLPLNNLWTGPGRYGLSGSMMLYIETKYGRESLIRLLKYNQLQEVLAALQTTEQGLFTDWLKYMQKTVFDQ